MIPRIKKNPEFKVLEEGLIQRVDALNLFLKDIYAGKQIIKDNIIPEEFVYTSSGYLAQCEGICPPGGVYSHISGIDLVKGKNGKWYILEDNLRVPSGASYPMIARELRRRCSPMAYQKSHPADNRNYAQLLKETMDAIVIAPELAKSCQLIKNKAVICPPHARKLSAIYGFKRWPAMVFVRDGAYLGAVDGLRLWSQLVAEVDEIIQRSPSFPPSIGIPVKSC